VSIPVVVITRLRLIAETTTNADVAEVTRQAADMYGEALWNTSVLLARLDAVSELHVPNDLTSAEPYCVECSGEYAIDREVPYPCPTVRALNGEAGE